MRTALLLIAHGSRREEANADLKRLAQELRAAAEFELVESAYLELAQPGIEEGAAACVGQGAERVVLLPYFLSEGVHVQEDLSAMHERLAARYPGIEFRLAEPLARHRLLFEIVKDRAREAIASKK